MDIKSKMVAMCTATVLTLAIAGQGFAAVIPFKDLENIKAKDKVLALQERGYVKGTAEGVFAPNHAITAAEGIQLIVNALELNLDGIRFFKEPKATDYFLKADNNAWYANALIVASVNGFELPRDLDPAQSWTREAFTYHLIQATENHKNLPMINVVPAEIADHDQLTISYDGAIQRALTYDVVELDAQGNFNPKANISRAEAAEEIYNILEYLKAHPSPTIDG